METVKFCTTTPELNHTKLLSLTMMVMSLFPESTKVLKLYGFVQQVKNGRRQVLQYFNYISGNVSHQEKVLIFIFMRSKQMGRKSDWVEIDFSAQYHTS